MSRTLEPPCARHTCHETSENARKLIAVETFNNKFHRKTYEWDRKMSLECSCQAGMKQSVIVSPLARASLPLGDLWTALKNINVSSLSQWTQQQITAVCCCFAFNVGFFKDFFAAKNVTESQLEDFMTKEMSQECSKASTRLKT